MKVKIGNFPKHYSTKSVENWYLEKRFGRVFWDVEEGEYTWYDKVITTVLDAIDDFFLNVPNRINAKREQKVEVRIDPWDVWNFDQTLAHIILPGLKKIRESKNGAPNVQNEDVPKDLHAPVNGEPTDDVDEHWFERWDYILGEMIFAFECISRDDWEDQFHSGNIDIHFEDVGDGYFEMKKGPNDTWKFDHEGAEKMRNRIQNGLRLFGKYYTSLWT